MDGCFQRLRHDNAPFFHWKINIDPMHTDARTLDDHSTIEGDICIIGAGAAGISVALEWILSPYRIILLEGGGFEYEERL